MTTSSSKGTSESPTRRQWIRQFALGSVTALGVAHGWRARLLADISPSTPPSNILSLSLANFPSLLDGSTPSVQLQLSALDEIIMINRAPFNGQFYVLDSRCTHQGCPVNRWDVNSNILCPCHGSNYNIDGSLIFGAAGPNQPPLNSYNFTTDGTTFLKIEIPGLNLKVNSIAVESVTAGSRRLRLTFPVKVACSYQVTYSADLTSVAQPVSFATTATGPSNNSSIMAIDANPISVWVDSADAKGFYRIELLLPDYNG